MSEIPFVNLLGDAIENAISHEAAPSPGSAASRWRPAQRLRVAGRAVLGRHRRASVVLVALVLGTGAVAVAETLQSSTALVTGGIVCYAGTSTGASVQMYANVEANGRSPDVACADVFRTDGPAVLARPGVKLTACGDPNGFVAVFRSTGTADQCQGQGLSPLQARSYAIAQSSVDRLVGALNNLGASRACIAPLILSSDVRRVLSQLGWRGWRPELQRQPRPAGGCGTFLGTGSSFSDPTASLDATNHVVWITAGPIPSLIALTAPLDLALLRASGRRCYTEAAARALARTSLAGTGVEIKFALTQEPAGGAWADAQGAYDRNCTIVVSVAPAPYGRIVEVWLNSKSGPPEPRGWAPARNQFR